METKANQARYAAIHSYNIDEMSKHFRDGLPVARRNFVTWWIWLILVYLATNVNS